MDEYIINNGTCGCITSIDVNHTIEHIPILFSNYFGYYLFVEALIIDSLPIGIFRKFETKNDLLNYLNNIFAPNSHLQGIFKIEGDYITYENFENFNKLEIMAVYGTRLLVYKFGLGGYPPDRAYTDILSDGDTVPGTALIGVSILGIWWNNDKIEQTTSEYSQDPINKSLTFARSYEGGNMWILVSDEIPIVPPPAFDNLFLPIQLQ